MKIELQHIPVRDLVEGYIDNEEEGVIGYGGKLNIRPPYQREFVYNDKQRKAVIDTIRKDLPLNVLYWSVNDDGTFEVLDGQQRIISICQYYNGEFSIDLEETHKDDPMYFSNLKELGLHEDILNYKLMVYFCEGTDYEKLTWFETINIAGEKLTQQELRNAIYSGPWVADAKIYFSKRNCPAQKIGSDYLNGSCIRQDFLEKAIAWINNKDVEGYMSEHQKDPDAGPLWAYFQEIIAWIERIFPDYYREMKGVDWGRLYNTHKDDNLNPTFVAGEVKRLMADEDVTSKKGIFEYVLTGKEKFLSIRKFSDRDKRTAFEKAGGICQGKPNGIPCSKQIDIKEAEADHIVPWSKGGKTEADNCQILCIECNRGKGGK